MIDVDLGDTVANGILHLVVGGAAATVEHKGSVTHVLVNDPTTGYGIFIENMLDAAA